MTFNGKNNRPRKSSTNTRALSTRLQQLQREMNPQVTCSGMTVTSSTKQYVTRKLVTYANLVSGSLAVTPVALGVPDGSKILKMVVKNLTGRTLNLYTPVDTGLILSEADGTSGTPFGGLTKTTSAPLSRFPTLTVQVPDLLARPLDAVSTALLFTVSATGGTTDTVQFTSTVRYTV